VAGDFVSENRMSYVVGGDRQKALSLTQNLVLRPTQVRQASIRLEPCYKNRFVGREDRGAWGRRRGAGGTPALLLLWLSA